MKKDPFSPSELKALPSDSQEDSLGHIRPNALKPWVKRTAGHQKEENTLEKARLEETFGAVSRPQSVLRWGVLTLAMLSVSVASGIAVVWGARTMGVLSGLAQEDLIASLEKNGSKGYFEPRLQAFRDAGFVGEPIDWKSNGHSAALNQ